MTSATDASPDTITATSPATIPFAPSRVVRNIHECSLDILATTNASPIVPRYARHGVRRRVDGRSLIFCRIGENRTIRLQALNGAMDVDAIVFWQD